MLARLLKKSVGPRIPRGDLFRRPIRYVLPALFFLAAIVLMVISIERPYWRMTLRAPQYPKGLTVHGYVDRLSGDVQEIDELNHYIGMRPLNDAAKLERAIGVASIYAFAVLLIIALLVHSPMAGVLSLPSVVFPAAFLLDLYFWLWNFGNHLDPRAPLSSSIKPFTPPVLGVGKVGQFKTVAAADEGLILMTIAAALVLVGLYLHRRAFRPLVKQQQTQSNREPNASLIAA